MAEPVSLDLAKLQLRLDGDAEDALVSQSIVAAREWVERYTGHLLVRRQVVEAFGGLTSTVNLRAWPDVVIDGITVGGAMLDPGAYVLSPLQRPAQLGPAAAWRPVTSAPVTVTMTAGYADGAVPARFVRAMLILIADMYTNRESSTLTPAAERAAVAWVRRDRRSIL